MKILLQIIGLTCCVLALAGCEWTAGGGVDSWDSSGDWVDFSGSYKAADGGILVRSLSANPTNVPATTNTTFATNTVSEEYLAVGNGTNTAFNGQIVHTPVRGSLTIFTIGGYRFTDSAGTSADTVALVVTPADGSAGQFNYSTRAWALTFPAPLANGTAIFATYQWGDSSVVINPGQFQGIQGNHGNAIYSFVIYQTGNKLQLTDSNGATYEGSIGTVRTTAGKVIDANDTTIALPTSGGVVAQFSATGISQGYKVTLVGVLQGTLISATSMTGRNMKATYVEDAGNEADVNAVAQ